MMDSYRGFMSFSRSYKYVYVSAQYISILFKYTLQKQNKKKLRVGFPYFSEFDQIFEIFHVFSSVTQSSTVYVQNSFDFVQIRVSNQLEMRKD